LLTLFNGEDLQAIKGFAAPTIVLAGMFDAAFCPIYKGFQA
jgi:hypothetical protein